MTELPLAVQIALLLCVVLAAAFDLRFRRIPNWLTAPGVVAGIGLQTGLRGWAGLRDAALGAAVAFAVYFAFFALRAMGAGDVKLMLAVGALAGPSNWIVIFLATSLIGGIIAVLLLVSRGTLLRTVARVLLLLKHLIQARVPYYADPEFDVSHPKAVSLPHALPIALGCLIYLALARAQM